MICSTTGGPAETKQNNYQYLFIANMKIGNKLKRWEFLQEVRPDKTHFTD